MNKTRVPLFCCLLALFMLAPVWSQEAPAAASVKLPQIDEQIIKYASEQSKLMENLQYLCDVIGPRLTGSENLKRANQFMADKAKEYGLQNSHLESYNIPRFWERGYALGFLTSPRKLQLAIAQRPWTTGTDGWIEGPIIIVESNKKEEYEKLAGKLKGAILLTSKPSKPQQHPLYKPRGYEEADVSVDKAEQERNEFFKAEGVAAILEDSAKPHMLVTTGGSWSAPLDGPKRFNISNEHYALLHRLAQNGYDPRVSLYSICTLRDEPTEVYNTVAEIPGTEKPDEVVICGAHLDSWDLGQGTTDNGTGSAVILEAARILTANNVKPKRTIRFIWFSGEEQGLVGSREYVKAHEKEMDKVSAVFVHDTGTGYVKGIGLHGSKQCQPVFESEFSFLNHLGVKDFSTNLMGGTDHAAFYPKGIPSFWFMQEGADYGLTHHTSSDTFDKAIEEDLIHGATVMALCALHAANRDEMLPRKPKEGGE